MNPLHINGNGGSAVPPIPSYPGYMSTPANYASDDSSESSSSSAASEYKAPRTQITAAARTAAGVTAPATPVARATPTLASTSASASASRTTRTRAAAGSEPLLRLASPGRQTRGSLVVEVQAAAPSASTSGAAAGTSSISVAAPLPRSGFATPIPASSSSSFPSSPAPPLSAAGPSSGATAEGAVAKPWKHPAELDYVCREDWPMDMMILYLCQNAFSVPPAPPKPPTLRDVTAEIIAASGGALDSRRAAVLAKERIKVINKAPATVYAQTFVEIRNLDGSVTVLPARYRLPLMFVGRFMWDSLRLVLTASNPSKEWVDFRFDIIHLSRLCSHLFKDARRAMGCVPPGSAQKEVISPKGDRVGEIDKSWRCAMFDRVLTRIYRKWMVSREWSVKLFWQEFGEEEYANDVLKYDWARWVLRGHKGFLLTPGEVANGITAAQFTAGLEQVGPAGAGGGATIAGGLFNANGVGWKWDNERFLAARDAIGLGEPLPGDNGVLGAEGGGGGGVAQPPTPAFAVASTSSTAPSTAIAAAGAAVAVPETPVGPAASSSDDTAAAARGANVAAAKVNGTNTNVATVPVISPASAAFAAACAAYTAKAPATVAPPLQPTKTTINTSAIPIAAGAAASHSSSSTSSSSSMATRGVPMDVDAGSSGSPGGSLSVVDTSASPAAAAATAIAPTKAPTTAVGAASSNAVDISATARVDDTNPAIIATPPLAVSSTPLDGSGNTAPTATAAVPAAANKSVEEDQEEAVRVKREAVDASLRALDRGAGAGAGGQVVVDLVMEVSAVDHGDAGDEDDDEGDDYDMDEPYSSPYSSPTPYPREDEDEQQTGEEGFIRNEEGAWVWRLNLGEKEGREGGGDGGGEGFMRNEEGAWVWRLKEGEGEEARADAAADAVFEYPAAVTGAAGLVQANAAGDKGGGGCTLVKKNLDGASAGNAKIAIANTAANAATAETTTTTTTTTTDVAAAAAAARSRQFLLSVVPSGNGKSYYREHVLEPAVAPPSVGVAASTGGIALTDTAKMTGGANHMTAGGATATAIPPAASVNGQGKVVAQGGAAGVGSLAGAAPTAVAAGASGGSSKYYRERVVAPTSSVFVDETERVRAKAKARAEAQMKEKEKEKESKDLWKTQPEGPALVHPALVAPVLAENRSQAESLGVPTDTRAATPKVGEKRGREEEEGGGNGADGKEGLGFGSLPPRLLKAGRGGAQEGEPQQKKTKIYGWDESRISAGTNAAVEIAPKEPPTIQTMTSMPALTPTPTPTLPTTAHAVPNVGGTSANRTISTTPPVATASTTPALPAATKTAPANVPLPNILPAVPATGAVLASDEPMEDVAGGMWDPRVVPRRSSPEGGNVHMTIPAAKDSAAAAAPSDVRPSAGAQSSAAMVVDLPVRGAATPAETSSDAKMDCGTAAQASSAAAVVSKLNPGVCEPSAAAPSGSVHSVQTAAANPPKAPVAKPKAHRSAAQQLGIRPPVSRLQSVGGRRDSMPSPYSSSSSPSLSTFVSSTSMGSIASGAGNHLGVKGVAAGQKAEKPIKGGGGGGDGEGSGGSVASGTPPPAPLSLGSEQAKERADVAGTKERVERHWKGTARPTLVFVQPPGMTRGRSGSGARDVPMDVDQDENGASTDFVQQKEGAKDGENEVGLQDLGNVARTTVLPTIDEAPSVAVQALQPAAVVIDKELDVGMHGKSANVLAQLDVAAQPVSVAASSTSTSTSALAVAAMTPPETALGVGRLSKEPSPAASATSIDKRANPAEGADTPAVTGLSHAVKSPTTKQNGTRKSSRKKSATAATSTTTNPSATSTAPATPAAQPPPGATTLAYSQAVPLTFPASLSSPSGSAASSKMFETPFTKLLMEDVQKVVDGVLESHMGALKEVVRAAVQRTGGERDEDVQMASQGSGEGASEMDVRILDGVRSLLESRDQRKAQSACEIAQGVEAMQQSASANHWRLVEVQQKVDVVAQRVGAVEAKVDGVADTTLVNLESLRKAVEEVKESLCAVSRKVDCLSDDIPLAVVAGSAKDAALPTPPTTSVLAGVKGKERQIDLYHGPPSTTGDSIAKSTSSAVNVPSDSMMLMLLNEFQLMREQFRANNDELQLMRDQLRVNHDEQRTSEKRSREQMAHMQMLHSAELEGIRKRMRSSSVEVEKRRLADLESARAEAAELRRRLAEIEAREREREAEMGGESGSGSAGHPRRDRSSSIASSSGVLERDAAPPTPTPTTANGHQQQVQNAKESWDRPPPLPTTRHLHGSTFGNGIRGPYASSSASVSRKASVSATEEANGSQPSLPLPLPVRSQRKMFGFGRHGGHTTDL